MFFSISDIASVLDSWDTGLLLVNFLLFTGISVLIASPSLSTNFTLTIWNSLLLSWVKLALSSIIFIWAISSLFTPSGSSSSKLIP